MLDEYFKNGFKEYIERDRFSDLKLSCGGTLYSTHRIILAYSSEFFATLLSSEFRESTQALIELKLPDPHNVFKEVLSFMYDGRVLLSPDNVIPLLSMAKYYIIKPLVTLCMQYIEHNLHRENVLTILKASISFHFDDIVDRCLYIVAKNFPNICETMNILHSGTGPGTGSGDNNNNNNNDNQYFKFLPPHIFLNLLRQPYLVVKNEYSLYLIVSNFIKYHNDLAVAANAAAHSSSSTSLSTSTSTTSIGFVGSRASLDSNSTGSSSQLCSSGGDIRFEPNEIVELMSQIRYIWMTYEQLLEVSNNPLVPKHILIETFMERLKKYEPHDASIEPTVSHSRFLPRPPQSILFEYNYDFDNKGIIYWIATMGLKEKWSNPHQSGRIKITSSSVDKGFHHDIVELSPSAFWTKDVPASWVTIDLGPNRSVIPMYYTIRHGFFKSDSLRTWDFQGSVHGEHWTVLKRHTNDASLNLKYATHTWQIPGVTTAYRYFRILQTGKNSNNRNFLLLGGFEIYGELLQR
ncbi:hypothetical protein SAMD00019534_004680 [Acytostelium subglobosum LB1]|uniref:hypothetical protein n=1 Tax=Acytostelium subglobosum LB1 TaxID=1410327 RepID=UPI0006449F3F|nr:hypothetical protein SAMD00019534_004680 [Acytostelium subglobosum LB1]GAM17293.1 hypothetical protein SAMD00019534_004680 [Acytostelium subglobosum LB1]|eukprot:XP_012759355.1 hypothetical protein SAMD00019534_004680 [Acytostelium subglobosum LB1]